VVIYILIENILYGSGFLFLCGCYEIHFESAGTNLIG